MISNDAENRAWLLDRVNRLVERLKEMDIEEDALDDLVHNAASEEATSVNNSGIEAQLEYLLRHSWKPEDILGRLNIAKEEVKPSPGAKRSEEPEK